MNKTSISLIEIFIELLKRGDFLSIEHPDYQDEKDYLAFKKLLGNDEIRIAVAQALEIIKWKPDSEELYAIHLISMNREDKAILLGEVAIEPLIRAIYRQWGETRKQNIYALAKIGKPAVPALIKYYKATKNWEAYSLLTVKLLKEELKDRNLSISGPKKALLDRLEVK